MGLQRRERDPSYMCHQSFYAMTVQEGFAVQVLENVPEYCESLVKQNLPASWSVRSEVVDPRLFGQPASRPRRYLIAYDAELLEWNPEISMKSVLKALRAVPVMDPMKYFWQAVPRAILTPSQDFGVLIGISFSDLEQLILKLLSPGLQPA